jgi:hypothetical protein
MLNRLAALTWNHAPEPCPSVVTQCTAPKACPTKKARRPVRIFRLVAEPTLPAQIHVRALLSLIAEETPNAVGQWVLKSDLEIVYRQLATREAWPRLHWNRIGIELGLLTRKRTVKLQGRRHVAYLVPLDAVIKL